MLANQLTVDDPKEASRAERHFTKSATNVELQGQFISEHKFHESTNNFFQCSATHISENHNLNRAMNEFIKCGSSFAGLDFYEDKVFSNSHQHQHTKFREWVLIT